MSIFKHARALFLATVALTGTAVATPDDRTDTNPTDSEPTDSTRTEPMNDPAPAPVVDVDDNIDPAPAPAPVPVVVVDPTPAPVYYESEELAPGRADAGGGPGGPTLERYGVAVALGGGVHDFASDTLRSSTDPGGMWNLRVAVGTRSPLAIEGAYLGSAQSINTLGLDNNALLVGNGLEGKLRINLLDEAVQPFAFGGIGWTRYSLRNTDTNTSAVANDDDVIEVPMGVGIAYKIAGLQLDARGEFRYATQADLMPSLSPTNSDSADLHRYSINTSIGYSF